MLIIIQSAQQDKLHKQNLVIIFMFSVYVIVFECLIIILFGAFVRLDTATLLYNNYFTGSLVLLLGFAMVSVAKKFLSWLSIANLLIILAVNFQWNLLWFQFWKSCFNGFSVSFTVQSSILINCISCSLCCLLSFTDFLGKINWRQLLLISLVQSVGFSLNSAVITYGLKAFDGGGGIQIFFLSGLYSYAMWVVGFKFKDIPLPKTPHTYNGTTFSIIGLLLILYGWPSFNAGGSLLSQSIADTAARIPMTQCAYINTILTLSAAVLSAFLYHTPNEKVKIDHFISAVINGGIIMASSTDILLNPVGGLVLGCVASVATVTILKYFQSLYVLQSLPDSTFRIFFGFLSGIFASIFVASRNNIVPNLAENLLIKAAYVLAAIAVTLGFGIIFGVGSGLIIKYIPGPTKQDINNDRLLWDIKEESMPIYPHDQIHKNILDTSRLNNSLVPRNQQRSPSFLSPASTNKVTKQDLNKNGTKKRQVDYVPPPKPLSPPATQSVVHNFKKSSLINPRMINSQAYVNRYDVTKPQSPMQIQENMIKEQPDHQDQPRFEYTSGTSNRQPPDIIKRLEYDEDDVAGDETKPNRPH